MFEAIPLSGSPLACWTFRPTSRPLNVYSCVICWTAIISPLAPVSNPTLSNRSSDRRQRSGTIFVVPFLRGIQQLPFVVEQHFQLRFSSPYLWLQQLPFRAERNARDERRPKQVHWLSICVSSYSSLSHAHRILPLSAITCQQISRSNSAKIAPAGKKSIKKPISFCPPHPDSRIERFCVRIINARKQAWSSQNLREHIFQGECYQFHPDAE
jgi:hypothetical protein